MSIFGTILPGGELEAAAVSVLDRWLIVYIAELERQQGLTARSVAAPRTIQAVSDEDAVMKWPENQTPAVFVAAPGITEKPVRDGDGTYTVNFALVIATIVSPRGDRDAPRTLAQRYASAVRSCLVQHRTLEGFAESLTWEGENYNLVDQRASRSLHGSRVVFEVKVRGVVMDSAGPVGDPPNDPYTPYEDWPEAESADVAVSRVSHT